MRHSTHLQEKELLKSELWSNFAFMGIFGALSTDLGMGFKRVL